MKTYEALGALALLALAGCSHRSSVSGAYNYRDARDAAELVLTQNQQQIMGSFSVATLQNDGSMTRGESSITAGTYDPQSGSLTLTVKASGPLSQPFNVTGTVAHGAIDLTFAGRTLHLTSSSQQDFEETVAALTVLGNTEQQAQALAQKTAEATKYVAQLTQDLDAYDMHIERSTVTPTMVRTQEGKILAAAQHDLGLIHELAGQGKGGSYAAGQVRFRIGQLDYQMGQIKYQVDQALSESHEHIGALDQRLASNPCIADGHLTGCTALGQAQERYSEVRDRVTTNLAQLSSDTQENSAAIEALNKQAGN